MISKDYITAQQVHETYGICGRTLDRVGVKSYRFTSRGKKFYRIAEIEAALSRHVSSIVPEKDQFDMLVDQTVEEVLRDLETATGSSRRAAK